MHRPYDSDVNETAFRELVSSKRRGVSASIARGGLFVLSLLYAVVARLRNLTFDLGMRTIHRVGIPVICVGNLTTGGTGKTPVVAWLANWFRVRGVRVAIVSRGYRALDATANDERLLLEQLCPDVPHVQDPDRVAAARRAVDEYGAELLILDDGFQHRRLHRDLDIVLIDCLNPFGFEHLLPRGLLREPVSALRRAQIIVITRTDQADSRPVKQVVRRFTSNGTHHICSVFRPLRLRHRNGTTSSLDDLVGQRISAFCGIGNPDGFRRTLNALGLQPVTFQAYPDHHHYCADDLAEFAQDAKRKEIDAFVTTHKDLVKLVDGTIDSPEILAIEIEMEFVGDTAPLIEQLEQFLS